MKIAVIGAGHVGSALGLGWLGAGRDVVFGVPDPESPKYAHLPQSRLAVPNAAAAAAEIIVLATPWDATEAAVRALDNLAGKILVDCTNPLAMGPDGLHLAVGFERSGAELVASWAPGASVFKSFNQTGAPNMAAAKSFSTRLAMFVAGDDLARKPVVMGLVADIGFEPFDAGPLEAARLLEPLAMLWIDQALKRGQGQNFGFAVARR